ncbi:Beta-galactosidase, partial [Trichinella pseudospiralis]
LFTILFITFLKCICIKSVKSFIEKEQKILFTLMELSSFFTKSIFLCCIIIFLSNWDVLQAMAHRWQDIFQQRKFEIDFENDRFLKDGKPYRYIAGEIHYFRIPEIYWSDRLIKVRAAGLNAVQTYVPWNLHEPLPGEYNFDGMANLPVFLQTAQQLGLDVILRPGPYICAEWENGGLPWWLLNIPDLKPRTSDGRFMNFVQRWFAELFSVVVPFLYKNGGPIISIQVENEYGSFPACDRNYMSELYHIIRAYAGEDTVLFTVDGNAVGLLRCGHVPGAHATVDFGPSTLKDVEQAFAVQRFYAPRGPLVNSEFYPGWFDVWGKNHSRTKISPIINSMAYMWYMNASFSMYVFHGGTNFGFMNCANGAGPLPVTTGYDYDAPLTEAGDLTPKYLAIREQIQQLTGYAIPYPLPASTDKAAYGSLKVHALGKVTELLDLISPVHRRRLSNQPLPFETIGLGYGYVLYETKVPFLSTNGQYVLRAQGVRDRAYVMIDGHMQAILNSLSQHFRAKLRARVGQHLQILVENLGRQCSGHPDPKGILGSVTLDGQTLFNWTNYPIEPQLLFQFNLPVSTFSKSFSKSNLRKPRHNTHYHHHHHHHHYYYTPTIYASEFLLENPTADTFFHPKDWSKGQMYLNEYNVGRYWPAAGPQMTLYVPKNFLKPGTNRMVIFEFESAGNCSQNSSDTCTVEFIDFPLYKAAKNI